MNLQGIATEVTGSRLWGWLFVAILVVQILPFWFFPYFPSQDGPTHLHNAVAMANTNAASVYDKYYQVFLHPAGNMLVQGLNHMLLQVFSPLYAEKLLLTGYAILMAGGFRYLMRAISPQGEIWALMIFLFLPNWFLHMGFWNFAYGCGLFCVVLGYLLRKQAIDGPCRREHLAIVAGGGLLLYFAHVVAWVLCLVAGILCAAGCLVEKWKAGERALRERARELCLPLLALSIPGVLLLLYMAGSKESASCIVDRSWVARLVNGILPSLHSYSDSDRLVSKAVATLACVLTGTSVGIGLWRGARRWWGLGFFLGAAMCVVLIVTGPDCVGTGGFIHRRLGFFAMLFLVLGAASQHRAFPALRPLSIACCVVAVLALACRWPAYERWNRELGEIAAAAQSIRPESTVLPVYIDRPTTGVADPRRHAVGVLSAIVPVVDLHNYEASVDYFLVRFRNGFSPFPALGTLKDLEGVPPQFDIERYERETNGKVDYVLCYGEESADWNVGISRLEEKLRVRGREVFRMVWSNGKGTVRLYQRMG